MTDEKPRKPFALEPSRTSFTLRDLDNAQPAVPPPRAVHIPNPRLAPPGMSGVKIADQRRPPPAPAPKPPKRIEWESGHSTRTFKSLAPPKPKGPMHER